MPTLIQHAIGNVGGDPKEGDTRVGPVVRLSLAVTKSYPDMGKENGETRWLSVSVFKDSVREQVMEKISKGMVICVEGVIEKGEPYKGVPQFNMKASRIGLVEWFIPSKAARDAQAKRFADARSSNDDEPEDDSNDGDW